MPSHFRFAAFALSAPFLLAGCVGGTSSASVTPSIVPQTPATLVATQSPATPPGATAIAGANSTPDWSGTSGPFPSDIVGGDGFQANRINDASFATLINSVRSSAGTTPLAYNAMLDSAAQKHAQDMFATGVLSHTGSNGSSVGDRVTAEGYVWRFVGENIAQGQSNENRALNGWISSPGHQANNVSPNFQHFGLGRVGSGSNTYWALVFAAQ